MSEDKLVPCIRFKGFVGEWENRSFKDIVTINSGKDYKHLSKGDIPVYGTGGLMLYVNDKLSEKDAIGIGRKGTIDRPQFLKAPFWTVDTLFFMVPKKKFNIYFVYCLSEKTNWKKYDESTGLPSLSKSTISKISSFTPLLKEQQKIGGLFAKLDRLLDLQQQKLDQLELLKKTMLQKLFPKQDAKIPELRFNGFEGEWKKDTIGDLIKSVGYKNFLADASSLGEYPVIQQGEEPVLGYSSKKPFQKYNDVVLFGDHTLSLYKPKSPFLIATDGIKIVFVKNWNGQFLYAFLQKYKPHSEGYKRHFTILKSKVGKYPLDIKEQQKIGNLLAKIDRLIELKNKKFSNLKLVKKSLLQNMFVE